MTLGGYFIAQRGETDITSISAVARTEKSRNTAGWEPALGVHWFVAHIHGWVIAGFSMTQNLKGDSYASTTDLHSVKTIVLFLLWRL